MKWLVPWALHPVTRGVGSSTGLNFDSFFHGKGPDSSMGSSGTLAGSRDANRDPREKLSKRYLVCAGRAPPWVRLSLPRAVCTGLQGPFSDFVASPAVVQSSLSRRTLPVCCSGIVCDGWARAQAGPPRKQGRPHRGARRLCCCPDGSQNMEAGVS